MKSSIKDRNYIKIYIIGGDIYENSLSGIMCAMSLQSCLTLCNPMDYSPRGSSVHRIPAKNTGSGLQCPPPGDVPNPGIRPVSLRSLALAGKLFTTVTTWKAQKNINDQHVKKMLNFRYSNSQGIATKINRKFSSLSHWWKPRKPILQQTQGFHLEGIFNLAERGARDDGRKGNGLQSLSGVAPALCGTLNAEKAQAALTEAPLATQTPAGIPNGPLLPLIGAKGWKTIVPSRQPEWPLALGGIVSTCSSYYGAMLFP